MIRKILLLFVVLASVSFAVIKKEEILLFPRSAWECINKWEGDFNRLKKLT